VANNTIVRVEHISKSFTAPAGEKDVVALDDVSLSIEAGDIFGIIGRSGEGKSTLVRCINYLERPTAGEVYFEGTAMSSLSRKELYATRRHMGMIFQQFNLLMQRNAVANVSYPMEIAGIDKKTRIARAKELLSLVGMGDKFKSYPAQLSGGQRQRVAIARAIALDPKVLLCDEATSALDPETTRGVLDLLRDINKRLGITVIIITHEMSVIKAVCRKLAILDEHKMVEEGTVTEVFEHPKSCAAKKLIHPFDDILEVSEDD
jgi:D-methionine transport system ATP-binding protein